MRFILHVVHVVHVVHVTHDTCLATMGLPEYQNKFYIKYIMTTFTQILYECETTNEHLPPPTIVTIAPPASPPASSVMVVSYVL